MRERKACPAFIQTTKRFSFGTAHALQGAERTLRGSAMTPRELRVRSGSGRSLGQWRGALSVSGTEKTEMGCVSQNWQGLVHLLGFFCCERSLRCKVLEIVSSGDKNPEICARLPRLIEECACSGRVDVDTRRPRRARPYSRIAGCSVPRCSKRRSAHARHLSARQRRRRCGVSLQRGVTGGLTAVCSLRQCALNVGFRAAPARGRLTRVYSKLITQRERLQGSLRGRFRKAYLIPQSALRVRGACLCRCSPHVEQRAGIATVWYHS